MFILSCLFRNLWKIPLYFTPDYAHALYIKTKQRHYSVTTKTVSFYAPYTIIVFKFNEVKENYKSRFWLSDSYIYFTTQNHLSVIIYVPLINFSLTTRSKSWVIINIDIVQWREQIHWHRRLNTIHIFWLKGENQKWNQKKGVQGTYQDVLGLKWH